tara:strand:- start:2940 stop:3239 length:300 start_codon:yes stop_codon:yes gene_type:complete
MKKVEKCIEDALDNIQNDRALAMTLLSDLMRYIKQSNDRHQASGPVAAKYLETLQRSNEQLVKITTLLHKKNSSVTAGLTKEDKEEIFDLIGNSEDVEA